MDHGLAKGPEERFSLGSLLEIHRILLEKTRGGKKEPGKIRTVQNWIGPPGSTLFSAVFIPPPPERVQDMLEQLHAFIVADDRIPPLIRIGLVHAQFETIHPFLDGNGRMGRLLITFYLYGKGILARPLLYLSIYLKEHRDEYYALLQGVRFEGDWEAWLKFFLKGIIDVSNEALATAKEIITLKAHLIDLLVEHDAGGMSAVRLLDLLFARPVITVAEISSSLGLSHQPAYDLVTRFEELGILREISGKKRYRKYLFVEYVRIIERGTVI
jgi:Fic family protein